jgi:hypothetical protein
MRKTVAPPCQSTKRECSQSSLTLPFFIEVPVSSLADGLLINPKVINRAIKYLVSSVLLILQVNIYTCLCYITRNGHIWISVILMVRSIDILTAEIAVEVTGVVGESPALWYFRYIASIFLTLHKRLCCNRVQHHFLKVRWLWMNRKMIGEAIYIRVSDRKQSSS